MLVTMMIHDKHYTPILVTPYARKTNQELAPQEIRRIRETLGLSRAEAGQLLGGGPRAFAKYENGSTKPSAAIVKTLKMLEADNARRVRATCLHRKRGVFAMKSAF